MALSVRPKPNLSDPQKQHRFHFAIDKQEEPHEYWEEMYFIDEQRFGLDNNSFKLFDFLIGLY